MHNTVNTGSIEQMIEVTLRDHGVVHINGPAAPFGYQRDGVDTASARRQGSALQALHGLLVDLFGDTAPLEQWLVFQGLGGRVMEACARTMSMSEFSYAIVRTLRRFNDLTPAFFDALAASFQNRSDDIERVRGLVL